MFSTCYKKLSLQKFSSGFIHICFLSLLLLVCSCNSSDSSEDENSTNPSEDDKLLVLAWDANSESYLTGYRVYFGTESRDYNGHVDVGNQTSYSMEPPSQTTYFAVTAYDGNGQESDFSNEVVWNKEEIQFTVTAHSGKGGRIDPSGMVKVVPGGSQGFSIVPDEGYYILDVLVNEESVGGRSFYEFTDVSGDQRISAVFDRIVEHGSLRVDISPEEAVSFGARWRIIGGSWQNSGATLSDLKTGNYIVQFNEISGFDAPSEQQVIVNEGEASVYKAEYVKNASEQITLAWDANSESHLTGYRVYFGTESRNYNGHVDVGNQTSFSMEPPSQTTYFAVTAYDGNGQESDFSNEVVWDKEEIQFTVTAHSGKGGRIDPSGMVKVVPGGSQSFSIVPDEGYYILDVLVNEESVGSRSFYEFTGVSGDQRISAVFDRIIEHGSLRVDISPEEAVSLGARWRIIGGSWQNSGATLSDLKAGDYIVQFKDISGFEVPSEQQVIVIESEAFVHNAEYVKNASDQITLAWDANSESHLAGYRVYFGNSSRDYDGHVDVGNQTSYSMEPPSQTTYFAVTAYDDNGQESDFSNEVVWKISQTPSDEDDEITLAWDANSEPHLAGYRVYSGPASRDYNSHVDVGNQTSYSMETPFQTTYFAVTAYDDNGQESDFSNEVVWDEDVKHILTTDDGGREDIDSLSTVHVSPSVSQGYSVAEYAVEHGSLRVDISPEEAVSAGARWRLSGGTWFESGVMLSDLKTGEYTIQFKDITDFTVPPDQKVRVSKGDLAVTYGQYEHFKRTAVDISPAILLLLEEQ